MTRRSSEQPDWGDTAWNAPNPARRDSRWEDAAARPAPRDESTRNLGPQPHGESAKVVELRSARAKAVYPRASGREMTTGPKEPTRVADPDDRTQLAKAAELIVAPRPASKPRPRRNSRPAQPPPPPREALEEARLASRAPSEDLDEPAHEPTDVRERPPRPVVASASHALSRWFRPDTGAQPTFLGGDPSESSSLAEWLGIEDEVTDSDGGMLPPIIEGRLERAQRRAEQGRAVQMEIELREAVRAARALRVRIPASRLRAIEEPCYRMAAQSCLLRAQQSAKSGDVVAAQNSVLSARHYASLGDACVDAKAVRKILRKANARAYSTHLAAAKKHAAVGNLPLTKMAVALARTSLAAAIENGARRRSVDALEALKVQARLNAIRHRQSPAHS